MRQQEPPNTVKVELVEGCNLRCSFCGLNGIRGKDSDYKYLTVAHAQEIVQRLQETAWSPRFEFAMHGEPTMNPNICEIIQLFRAAYPQNSIMLTSNGSGIQMGKVPGKDVTERVLNLFRAGFSTVALNAYQNIQWVPRIWEECVQQKERLGKIRMLRWPEDKDGNLHERRPKEQRLIRLFAIDLLAAGVRPEGRRGNHARLANHAGCGAPRLEDNKKRKCAKPFREFAIRWDGGVGACCEDWRGEYACGNVFNTPIEEIWQGAALRAMRHKLYHGLRDFGPCLGCSDVSTRVGLLPDYQGKCTEPLPDKSDLQAINRAIAAGPLTTPVLRPWELVKIEPSNKPIKKTLI